jgi:hypothetical protein
MISRTVLLGLLLLGGAACTDQKKKIQEAQKERAAARKALEEADEAKRKAALPKIEPAQLEPFWSDSAYVKVSTGKPCPEGLWALFPQTPGEGAAQEANQARRAELLAKVRATTFYAVLPFGTGVTLRKYNPKKKRLTVEVEGVVECFDGAGLFTLAWGQPAKPVGPKGSDDDDEPGTPQRVWRARPLLFPLPFASAAEAKAFAEKEGLGAEARVVFTLGKVAVDKKVVKTPHPTEDGPSGEDAMDWGAGRLVHVNLLGVRVARDHEKVELAVQRKP